MHWLFFVYVRTDHDGGKKFLRRGMQKYCGVVMKRKPHVSSQAFVLLSIAIYFKNKYILSEILKKGRC